MLMKLFAQREFVLNYDHLDQRHGTTQPNASL